MHTRRFTLERLSILGPRACSRPYGLHIIYGANEAGKTSALRAVRDMLYGIPERTSDGFIHGNDQLRIGGRVCLSNGSELAFLRRKGRKRTLLTFHDSSALDDSTLDPFLTGISREVFETLFAIDHEELVRGGEALLMMGGQHNVPQ